MKTLMTAPVVPKVGVEKWAVVHADNVLGGRDYERYAFTSRETLEQWAATREDGWQWLLLSVAPNKRAIVLDEAWPWKYAEQVPEMTSAEDGRRVLEMLLRGSATSAQKALMNTNDPPNQKTHDGVTALLYMASIRDVYHIYVDLDPTNWAPDSGLAVDGETVSRRLEPNHAIASPTEFVGEDFDGAMLWFVEDYVGPVKTVGPTGYHLHERWAPDAYHGSVPLYLRLLA